MDRPFREIHELYRINFLRVQAKKEADEEEERKKKEEERRQKASNRSSSNNSYNMSPDANLNNIIPSSLLESDDLEEALEELAEGSVM